VNIIKPASLVITVLANLYLCFYIGHKFVEPESWYLVPLLVTLVAWFMFIALICAVVAENMINNK